MSRVGSKPIPVPQGVTVTPTGRSVLVKSAKGQFERPIPDGIELKIEDGTVQIANQRPNDRRLRALHGLTRSLVANDVLGLSAGWVRGLEIIGVGYRAELKGRSLNLSLGYSHPIDFPLPDGVEAEVQERPVRVTLRGADKQLLGQTAAKLRALRPPEPYKGKGVRYADEVVKTKVGKTGLK